MLAPAPGKLLKIAVVGDWFLPRLGGIELQTRDLARGLIARGHEVTIITGVPGPTDVEELKVERLTGPRVPGAGIAVTPDVFLDLRRRLKAGGYDVVHVQFGIVAPIAHAALALAGRLGLPALATFHSAASDFRILMVLLNGVFGYRQWTVRYGAVSTLVADIWQPLVRPAPISVVPNGIDLDWWQGPSAAPAEGPIEIISVMRLHRRKRPGALVEAFGRALAGLPERAARLTIVGDGEERENLRRRVARLGLEPSVVLAGSRSREAIRDMLHGSHVFALASKLEAFGIAMLEARAAGLPVVTMQASGGRDFLTHGRDALLAADDDALAAHLRRLILEPDLLQRLTEAAGQRPGGVDWSEVVPRYEQEYFAAMARVGASA